MRMDYITFRSITPAQRGERILQREGIGCVLLRTPRDMAKQGCGYCLRLQSRNTVRAVELLRDRGIPYSRVYAQNGEGAMEELAL